MKNIPPAGWVAISMIALTFIFCGLTLYFAQQHSWTPAEITTSSNHG